MDYQQWQADIAAVELYERDLKIRQVQAGLKWWAQEGMEVTDCRLRLKTPCWAQWWQDVQGWDPTHCSDTTRNRAIKKSNPILQEERASIEEVRTSRHTASGAINETGRQTRGEADLWWHLMCRRSVYPVYAQSATQSRKPAYLRQKWAHALSAQRVR